MVKTTQRVVIAGASGFIGSALSREFADRGYEVIKLRRGEEGKETWDPESHRLDEALLAGADAVVCLSGANLAGRPWTKEYKKTLLRSRLDSVGTIVEAIGRLAPDERPRAFLCSSAVGIYGASCGDTVLTEEAPTGKDFLARLCLRWEATARRAHSEHGVRTILARTGLVISDRGGILQKMLPVYRLGLGAQLGSGQQWMPIISLHDCVRAFIHAAESGDLNGPVNVCAPVPVRNGDFHRALAASQRRVAFLRIPRWLISGIGREFARQTLLASQRAIPQALIDSGFTFSKPDIDAILSVGVEEG